MLVTICMLLRFYPKEKILPCANGSTRSIGNIRQWVVMFLAANQMGHLIAYNAMDPTASVLTRMETYAVGASFYSLI